MQNRIKKRSKKRRSIWYKWKRKVRRWRQNNVNVVIYYLLVIVGIVICIFLLWNLRF